MTHSLSSRFEEHIQGRGFFKPKDKILIACSGGPDSTALLHLLAGLRLRWKFRLTVIHFDHGLRGKKSTQDAQFVRKLAARYELPFVSGKGAVKSFARQEKFSTEEAARIQRYDFFQKTAAAKKITKMVTAHTLNDQAETVWMRVLQGTGLRGLCGIRENSPRGRMVYVRPLLGFTKKEILDYLKERKIYFRKDASNQSLKILRNKIRLKLMPFLEKNFHPKVLQAAARIPEILNFESEALERMEKELWPKILRSRQGNRLHLHRSRFLAQPAALQFRLLDRALKTLNPKSGLSFEAWRKIQTRKAKESFRHSLPQDIDFDLTPSQLMIYRR